MRWYLTSHENPKLYNDRARQNTGLPLRFHFFLFQLTNRGTKLCLCKVKDAIVWITRLEKSSQIFSSYSLKICIISFILDHLSSYQRELTLYGDHKIMSHDHVSPEKERNKVGWSCTCHAFNTLLDKHMQRRIVT